ncbi:primosomal protein N' [Campylobacter gastrosuis]|uniref:Replication restart protein PriA n=1 Tax=Campylobacter gastrosuis TaxID=2974576 RepID=A0ABT7HSY4_9BACT|nr:primosomal protein N' [Campylobacter gastrosuis]MDL0090010.1 primosomal protein N' [Campylobacter gastrosuis]
MFYYKVAFSGLNVAILTYQSEVKISLFNAVLAPLKGKDTLGYIVNECEKPSFKTLNVTKILPLCLNKIQTELLNFIAYYYTSPFNAVLPLFLPKELGFYESKNASKIFTNKPFLNAPNLSQNQKKAFDFLNENKTALLFGDTGSGKSEIYISMIKDALNMGKQALFLMPEISLTPQMQSRLERYFGESVAVWHSKITPKNKAEILKNIKNKSVKLIAGARSALFLPLDDLGLIVVDEEHDDSYKNSASKPHYNARDLALFLGAKFNIKVILGSATPSLTTFHKLQNFRLKGTFFKSEKTYIFDKSEVGLSQILKDEISKTLSAKKQAVICLPTRANFRHLACVQCGERIKCPFCSVGMSFYKKEQVLKCQYCEFKMAVPSSCGRCGSDMIEAKKLGTSELVEILEREFANARVAKFDRDEITTQNRLKKALNAFNKGEIDLLVGTQMLSKGHDYHNVDLAVIMGVDELLAYPDFRARERTLSLVKQVAGRAGRKGQGRVVLQTFEDDFFRRFLDDYDGFLADEVGFRDPLYPPFARLLRLVISHKNEREASRILNECVAKIEHLRLDLEFEIIGYGKCGIEILASKYRYEVLLRASSHKPLVAIAKACVGEFIDVDIDPVAFL